MKKIPDDINKLDERIADFSIKKDVARRKVHLTSNRLFAKSFVLGTEFVGAVVVGMGLGYVLDMICHSKIVFMLIFSLFGCVAGVLNVYRRAKEMEKDLD
jgi:F0F1-type ATP synthase assembly protein I